jgi:glucose-1-phosphatase
LRDSPDTSLVTKQNIDGLLFDIGGVVFEIDFVRAVQTWSSWSRLSAEEIQYRFKMDEAYEQHERGQMQSAEYFNHLRKVLELEADDAEIELGWNAIFQAEMVDTVSCILAAKDKLPCFAFSNSNPVHQKFWMDAYPRAIASFHEIFVSSELGWRKPEREAFDAISRKTGISLERILFFDDTEENVTGARAAGMQAVHVRSHTDVKKALTAIGVLKSLLRQH